MSIWRLPEEIQVHIFVRLPGNSILACRCVCKTLLSLLSKPYFIKIHLDRSIKKNNLRFMVDHIRHDTPPKNRTIYSIDYASLSSIVTQRYLDCQGATAMDFPFEYEAGLAWMKKRRKMETAVFEILGSCNGLICLGISTGMYRFEEDDSICIWNPVTREYKKISLPLCDFYSVRYGFGYDSSIDDYKLVRVSDDENSGSFKIEVYTLGSDSWSTIQTPVPYSFPADITHGLLFKGALHWLGSTTNQKSSSSSEVIVSFDVSSERLVDFSLPEEATPLKPRSVHKNLGVLGDHLCLAFIDSRCSHVWVMQDYGVRESWTKQFTLPPVTRYVCKPVWCLESDDILIETDKGLILYIQGNIVGHVRICGVNIGRNRASYVESIVSLKSGTYVEKRERPIDILEACEEKSYEVSKREKKRKIM